MSAPTLPPIRFRFRPQKALAAIHQMLVWAMRSGADRLTCTRP